MVLFNLIVGLTGILSFVLSVWALIQSFLTKSESRRAIVKLRYMQLWHLIGDAVRIAKVLLRPESEMHLNGRSKDELRAILGKAYSNSILYESERASIARMRKSLAFEIAVNDSLKVLGHCVDRLSELETRLENFVWDN